MFSHKTLKKAVAACAAAATLALGGIAVASAAAEPFDTTQSPLKPLTHDVDKTDNGNYVSFLDAYNAGASQRNDGGYDDNIIINEHTKHKYYVSYNRTFAMLGFLVNIGVFDYDTGKILPCSDISIAQNPYTDYKTLKGEHSCSQTGISNYDDFTVKVAGEDQPVAKITSQRNQSSNYSAITGWVNPDNNNFMYDSILSIPANDNRVYKPSIIYIPAGSNSSKPDTINVNYYKDALDTKPIPMVFYKDTTVVIPQDNMNYIKSQGAVYTPSSEYNSVFSQATTGAHFTINTGGQFVKENMNGFPNGLFRKAHVTSAALYVDHSERTDDPVTQEKPAVSGDTIHGHAILLNDTVASDTEEKTLQKPHAHSILPSTVMFNFVSDNDCSGRSTPGKITASTGLYDQAATMNSLTTPTSHLKMQVELAQPDAPNPYYDQYYVGMTADTHGGYEPNITTQSDELTIKPPTLSSEKQTVSKNATLQATDGVINLPDACAYKATVTQPADTSRAGETSQTDNIHFIDGSEQNVSVPVTVTGDESDNYSDSNITTVTVSRGGTVHDKDGLGSLPSDATVHVDTPADTSEVGKTKQVVTIHFGDGSSKQVTVPVTVQGNDADNSNITTSDVTVHKGDTVDKTAGLAGVPEDATISVDTAADTSKAGSTSQTVTVHFKDGSTKQYTVNITVKDKIPASMITPVPSYDVHANVSTVTVSRGGALEPTDGLKNIPEGAKVTVVTPADMSHAGDSKQVVKMTFKDGSSMLITVPVTVQPTAADSYSDDNIKPVTVLRGGTVHDKDGLGNLPEDATVHVDTPADTSHAGKTQQVVTIHFKDGSTKQVTVNVTVQPTAADSYDDSNIKPVTAHKGDVIKPTDGLGNLPEGAKAIVVTPADTSRAGNTKQVVKITFADGSSKQVTVNVTVKDKVPASMIMPIPSYDTHANVTGVTVHQGDKLKPTDGLKNIPDGANVTVVTPADTSRTGDSKQVVKITFKDGSSVQVNVPVTVKARIPASVIMPVPSYDTTMNITKVTVHKGDKLKSTDGLKNLPEGAKVTVITAADTTHVGNSKQVVKITFKDGSSRTVSVPVTVKDATAWTSIMPVPTLVDGMNVVPVSVLHGDVVKDTAGLKNLPKDATVTVIKHADTSKIGKTQQVVEVTFKNGSSRTIIINVTVKPTLSDLYNVSNVGTVTVHKGDKLKDTDGLVNLPEGTLINVLKHADTSKVGTTEQVVKLMFKDGSSKTITIHVTVEPDMKTVVSNIVQGDSLAVTGANTALIAIVAVALLATGVSIAVLKLR